MIPAIVMTHPRHESIIFWAEGFTNDPPHIFEHTVEILDLIRQHPDSLKWFKARDIAFDFHEGKHKSASHMLSALYRTLKEGPQMYVVINGNRMWLPSDTRFRLSKDRKLKSWHIQALSPMFKTPITLQFSSIKELNGAQALDRLLDILKTVKK